MQDEYGQVLEAAVDLGRARLPGRRPRALATSRSIGRAEYPTVTDAEVIEAFQLLAPHRGDHPRARAAPTRWPGSCARRRRLPGATVLMNLSGRGDKDVAQMMEMLGTVTASAMEASFRAARGRRPQAARARTSPAGCAGWQDAVRAAAAAGADAIEIGIPFSDPVMDGPVIQQASQQALGAGRHAGCRSSTRLATLDVGVPLAVMTYYNIVLHAGHERFAEQLAAAGVAGGDRARPAARGVRPVVRGRRRAGVETVMLAAPTAPDERLPRIVARGRGLRLRGRAARRDRRARPAGGHGDGARRAAEGDHRRARCWSASACPTRRRRAEAVRVADGVVQGASVVRRLLDGGPDAVGDYVAEVRAAIDRPRRADRV